MAVVGVRCSGAKGGNFPVSCLTPTFDAAQTLEIGEDAFEEGDRVAIVDDLLATENGSSCRI